MRSEQPYHQQYFYKINDHTGVACPTADFFCTTAKADVPSFPMLSAKVRPLVVLPLLDHRSADGAGAGEEVE